MQQACIVVFFFNDTATTEIYTLSLHDALPILAYNTEQIEGTPNNWVDFFDTQRFPGRRGLRKDPSETLEVALLDRKSTRLNSSHANISYAVFCLKKKDRSLPRT